MQQDRIDSVSVVGLGKLGSPMAACFAAKGFTVIGVDLNAEFVKKVDQGLSPVEEPGLADLLSANKSRISATSDFEKAVVNSHATFIIVPTPSDDNGVFTNKYVLDACEYIGKALKSKSTYHLVVITSTVMPGSTEQEILPSLEKHSGKKCGPDFGLCYSPEFIALGTVIRDLLHPDFVLIGESDERAGRLLEDIYKRGCNNDPPAARMNFVNAELTKISVNTFVTTKISYANMLAEVCDQLPGADIDVVTDAIGRDSRIGRKYLKGATGYGGPCFPRDNVAFGALARSLEVSPTIAEATDTVNRRQPSRIAELLLPHVPANGTVAVLGMSYKPGTPVIEESAGISLVTELLSRGLTIKVFDPSAAHTAKDALGDKVTHASSIQECVEQADGIVIMLPIDEFYNLDPKWVSTRSGKKPVVLDCWRSASATSIARDCEYIGLGRGPKVERRNVATSGSTAR